MTRGWPRVLLVITAHVGEEAVVLVRGLLGALAEVGIVVVEEVEEDVGAVGAGVVEVEAEADVEGVGVVVELFSNQIDLTDRILDVGGGGHFCCFKLQM
jgi:hypothetical protein